MSEKRHIVQIELRGAEDSNEIEDSAVFLAFPSHGDFRQDLSDSSESKTTFPTTQIEVCFYAVS
jgi:hypothetical protein